MGSWVGSDFDRYKKVYGDPKETQRLPNGKSEYAYPLRGSGSDCVAYWEVDNQNKIAAWRHSGTCRMGPL
jgi:hypothetical protein